MSDNKNKNAKVNAEADAKADPKPADNAASGNEQAAAKTSVKRGGLIVFAVIALTLIWYLTSDRFTPYTSQARVNGYVVGVAPKVAGLVTDVWVTNNMQVEQGQRLFQIDVSQYEIALAKAKSDLENTKSQIAAGASNVDAARAQLVAAQANALRSQQDTSRQERLYEEDPGTVSVRKLEMSRAGLKQANAQVTAAEAAVQAAIDQMGGDVEANNAILKSAQAAVDQAALNLANTTVVASTSGVITDLTTDVGLYAGTGKPVLTLVAIDDVWISADFTENNLAHMQVGTPVEILFDVMPGEVFEGKIRSIGLGVSAGNQQQPGNLPSINNNRDWLRSSQRFPVIVGFDVNQSPQLRQQLRVGGQASVIVYTEGHGVLEFLGKGYVRLLSWMSYAY